jgi:hypothetical protein
MEITRSAGSSRQGIFLDASVQERHTQMEIVRNEVQKNRIAFFFPDGFADIPVIEECRILEDIENFDLMYDIMMQKLSGKRVEIGLRDGKGVMKSMAKFVITNRYMDLRGVDFIAEYPVVIAWLLEFMQDLLLKKFPLPPEDWSLETEAAKKRKAPVTQKNS